MATTLAAGPGATSRQDGQSSFGDSNKFNAGSDSTSSPVPSTVGNSVGQPTPFNLGEIGIIIKYFVIAILMM